MRIGKPPGGPWYGEFRRRLSFEVEARRHHSTLQGRLGSHNGNRAWCYHLLVEIPSYGQRRLTIVFPGRTPKTPHVFADGPVVARHRFDDLSLCIWYWRDPPERRWLFNDRLGALIDHAIIHLFKEAWFMDTGEWLGDEVSHDPRKDAA